MHKILAIFGPTSTGKTDLGIKLAKKLNGELVACDSRQVNKGLDLGTGKLPSNVSSVMGYVSGLKKSEGCWEINGEKIWMYDVADPTEQYSVYRFVKDADKVINEVVNRGKLPIIVGGSGLYLKALFEGLANLEIPVNQELRKELSRLSLQELQKRFKELSSQKWAAMNDSDRQNPRRLVRAIEIATGRLKGFSPALPDKNHIGIAQSDLLKIGLTAHREILYQRIDERIITRIKQGMIDEAIKLLKGGLSTERMRELGLEYGALADYLEGKTKSREELIKILQGKIHGYARRQITWFKREKNVLWFDITDKNYLDKLEKLVTEWYYK